MKTTYLVAMVVAVVIVIAGVVGYIYLVPQQSAGPKKIAMLITGSISDQGWSTDHYNAFKAIQAKYPDATYKYTDMVDKSNQVGTLNDYCSQGFNLIITTGLEWQDAVLQVAPNYPNVWFGIVAGTESATVQKNVYVVDIPEMDGSFLLGVVAGLMTKTNTIGDIMGDAYPSVIRAAEAYKLGAKEVNNQTRIIDNYLGTWTDPAKGKEAATAEIEAGADIIFGLADASEIGVFEACVEHNKYVMGSYTDKHSLAPNNTLTSFLAHWNIAHVDTADLFFNNTLDNRVYKFGIASGATDIAPYYGLVPSNVSAIVDDYRTQIINGSLVIPEITIPT